MRSWRTMAKDIWTNHVKNEEALHRFNPLTPNDFYESYRTANLQTLHFIYLFNKYRYWIFYTCSILSFFFSSKCSLFHNANFFGSCIIHILYVLKLKKIIPAPKD